MSTNGHSSTIHDNKSWKQPKTLSTNEKIKNVFLTNASFLLTSVSGFPTGSHVKLEGTIQCQTVLSCLACLAFPVCFHNILLLSHHLLTSICNFTKRRSPFLPQGLWGMLHCQFCGSSDSSITCFFSLFPCPVAVVVSFQNWS